MLIRYGSRRSGDFLFDDLSQNEVLFSFLLKCKYLGLIHTIYWHFKKLFFIAASRVTATI
eukprot:UN08269